MLTVAVVDTLAESRVRLSSEINRVLCQPGPDFHLIPRINVIPLAFQELTFHAHPQVVVVGSHLIDQEITTISSIREQLPNTKILALIAPERNRIGSIEHLIRLGADDVLDADASGKELITRLILLARRVERKETGRLLLVDGVKGGVGATSVAAAFAELLANRGKSVVVVDGDGVNRCLSRFLRARPLINENLQLILDGLRSSTPEFVAQAKCNVLVGQSEIGCVAPVSEEKWSDPDGSWVRNFINAIEVLDESSDYVIVDLARLTHSVRQALYRGADGVVLVASQDPACLPATIERAKAATGLLSRDVPIVILRNERDRDGISTGLWLRELKRVANVSQISIAVDPIPYSSDASRWPVSGHTFASLGTARMLAALESSLQLCLGDQVSEKIAKSSIIKSITTAGKELKTGIQRLNIRHPFKRSNKSAPQLGSGVGAIPLAPFGVRKELGMVPGSQPQIEFFVSGATFESNRSTRAKGQSDAATEELLVSPAKMSAA